MPMNAKINETGCLVGELKVLQRLNKYEFGVELWLMREGVNRNRWDYRNLEEYFKTFVGQPILIAYVGNRVGDGHNMEEKTDPKTRERYYSFTDATAERIVGTLSDDINDFSLVERDGHKWLKAKGRLFEFYAREAVQEIRRTGRMDVSVETKVFESHTDGDAEVFTKWAGLGVTILGEGVAPAIPGASIAKLAAMRTEFNDVKLKAASYRENETKTQANNKPKKTVKGVKNSMNKLEVQRLSPLFEGYRIVGLSDDSQRVVLLNDKGAAFEYNFLSEDNGEVVKSRIKPVALNCSIGEGENALRVEVDSVIEVVTSAIVRENGEIKSLSEQLKDANARIAAMQEFENKRRVDEANAVATATLSAFNAHREDKVDATAIAAVIEDVNHGVYTNSVDADGNWTGNAAVKSAVLAICAAKVQEQDEARANEKRNHTLWGDFNGNAAADNTVGGMLHKWGIETAE